MRRLICMVVLAAATVASAQLRRAEGIRPRSGIERPEDIGQRMHTTYVIYAPEGTIQPQFNPGGETPGSLGCVYKLVSNPVAGCPIATATQVSSGGSGVIVIVDAYDYPTAAADLATFSTYFGLPPANFSVQYASGIKPVNGCSSGWQGEESLDIEWAHAMAPHAQIVLMEASSPLNSALYQAVVAANSYIASHGGKGEVSMSWGGSETNSETGCRSLFHAGWRSLFRFGGRFSRRDLSEFFDQRSFCWGYADQSKWQRKLYQPNGVDRRWRRL